MALPKILDDALDTLVVPGFSKMVTSLGPDNSIHLATMRWLGRQLSLLVQHRGWEKLQHTN